MSTTSNKSYIPDFLEDLTPDGNLKQIETYSKALTWGIENKNVQNIALTGPYGSGKSSILKTFESKNQKLKFLNISLATFKEDKEEVSEEQHRLIELSILQQIFYKVSANEIPNSRFKRISKIDNHTINIVATALISLIVALSIVFPIDFLKSFDWWPRKGEYSIGLFITVLFLTIPSFLYLINILIKSINSLHLKKVNISGAEIDFDKDKGTSILNKHIDEILYFFEQTTYNVVVIEDLDRFNSTEIFTKLRELCNLINTSKQVGKNVTFIYAIKDDKFKGESTTRSKFFDLIIPVIPVINNTNSLDVAISRVIKANLDIPESVLEGITLYINDMRLLKNIFNEFFIYSENLEQNNIPQKKIFGMIVYKNLYPNDFSDLHINKGCLFSAFTNVKRSLITHLTKEIEEQISNYNGELKIIQEEKINSISELLSIYKIGIIKLSNNQKPECHFDHIVLNRTTKAIHSLNQNECKMLSEMPVFTCKNIYSGQVTNLKFSDVEKSINPDQNYIEREKAIFDRQNKNDNIIKTKIEHAKNELNGVAASKLTTLLSKIDTSNKLLDTLKEKEILLYLLRAGLIDEDYQSIISYFYEGSISLNDMKYLRSIKNRTPLPFSHELTKKATVINRLSDSELSKDISLNTSLINYILENKQIEVFSSKLVLIMNGFNHQSKRTLEFFESYLENGKHKELFIEALCENWLGVAKYIIENQYYSADKQKLFIDFILNNANTKYIENMDRVILSEYISSDSYGLINFSKLKETEKAIKLANKLDVKFSTLTWSDSSDELFSYLYNNFHYEINEKNINTILNTFSTSSESKNLIKLANYSAIRTSGCEPLIKYIDENINKYVSTVFLKIEENVNETENRILSMLQNESISIENKKAIIIKENVLISSISDVEQELWETILNSEKMVIDWKNIYNYYEAKGDIDDHLSNYLNKSQIYFELSINSILASDSGQTTVIENLANAIIVSNSITNDSFRFIIKSIPYTYSEISIISQVSSRVKLEVLITNNMLTLSPETFAIIKEKHTGLHIALIANNIEQFIEQHTTIRVKNDDYEQLLYSPEISANDKIKIVKIISPLHIQASAELSKIVFNLIKREVGVQLSFDVIEKLVKTLKIVNEKIELITLQKEVLSNEQTIILLNNLQSPYKDLTGTGGNVKLDKNQINSDLLQTLESKGIISSITIDNEKTLKANLKRK